MKPQAAVALITIAFAALSSGCSSSSSNSGANGGGSSNGGVSGTGGSTGTGSGDTCKAVTACGGDLVGAWTAKSSCLKASGTADISYLGLACSTAEIVGSIEVTGTFTVGSDGFTDATVAKGRDTWALGASCLELSGTKVTCAGVGSVFSSTLSSYGYQWRWMHLSGHGKCNRRAGAALQRRGFDRSIRTYQQWLLVRNWA